MKRLKRKLSELFEKGRGFLKEINLKEKLVLIHDGDVDGFVSAAIALEALKRLNIKVLRILVVTSEDINKVLDRVKKYDRIIILDVPMDRPEDGLLKIKNKILYVDHHFSKDLNRKNIVYINPMLKNPEIYQPTSYVAYKFFSSLVNLKDKEWLAVIGTIADYGFQDCKDLLKKYVKVDRRENVWKTKFGKAVMLINGAIAILKPKDVLKLLTSAKNTDTITKSRKIKSAYKMFLKEYNRSKLRFWKNVEKIDNMLLLSTIRTKYRRVGSTLATEIGSKYPNKMVMVLERRDGLYKIHARYRIYEKSKFHLGRFLYKCCKGLGGGHRQAAGGSIAVRDFKKFKNRLIKELKREI